MMKTLQYKIYEYILSILLSEKKKKKVKIQTKDKCFKSLRTKMDILKIHN